MLLNYSLLVESPNSNTMYRSIIYIFYYLYYLLYFYIIIIKH